MMSVKYHTKLGKTADVALKLVILFLSYYFLALEINRGDAIPALRELISIEKDPQFILIFLMALLLMPLNIGLESFKWQLLIQRIESISVLSAFKATLAGMTMSFFTPNRVGEYISRGFILQHASRVDAGFYTFVCSMSQLLLTLLAGLAGGFLYLYSSSETGTVTTMVLAVCALFCASAFLLLYFKMDRTGLLLSKMIPARFRKARNKFADINIPDRKALTVTLYYSALRYAVFFTQYYLMAVFFGLPWSFSDAFTLITTAFLLTSAIPTIALSELGVRGSVMLFLWQLHPSYHSGYEIKLISAIMLLWLLNIVIPTLAGTFFVRKMKIIR